VYVVVESEKNVRDIFQKQGTRQSDQLSTVAVLCFASAVDQCRPERTFFSGFPAVTTAHRQVAGPAGRRRIATIPRQSSLSWRRSLQFLGRAPLLAPLLLDHRAPVWRDGEWRRRPDQREHSQSPRRRRHCGKGSRRGARRAYYESAHDLEEELGRRRRPDG
jgi:hypothetical protein